VEGQQSGSHSGRRAVAENREAPARNVEGVRRPCSVSEQHAEIEGRARRELARVRTLGGGERREEIRLRALPVAGAEAREPTLIEELCPLRRTFGHAIERGAEQALGVLKCGGGESLLAGERQIARGTRRIGRRTCKV
jgi:hypothetical protein